MATNNQKKYNLIKGQTYEINPKEWPQEIHNGIINMFKQMIPRGIPTLGPASKNNRSDSVVKRMGLMDNNINSTRSRNKKLNDLRNKKLKKPKISSRINTKK